MPLRSVDPLSPQPRYLQIADMIRDMIRGGELAYGDPIPSQQQIREECHVAKATCGKALRALVDSGHVVVVPGMGARVTGRPLRRLSA